MTTLETRPFLNDGKTVVQSLRRALAQLLAAASVDPNEPQEIARKCGIDKMLAWRIARAVREDDAWEALQHLPTRHGIGILVTAIAKCGASPERVAAVWDAFGAFERFVELHARDRETLEMMVSVKARKSAEKRLEAFRKAGYQANSALLGVRASAQFNAALVAPSAASGMVDVASITGLVEFLRLRPNVPWAVASMQAWGGVAAVDAAGSPRLQPIDPSADDVFSPLIREFCSQPLPEIRLEKHPRDVHRYMMAEGPIGYTAAATLVSGWLYPQTASAQESYPGERAELGANLCTPVEMFVLDVFVHKDLPAELAMTAQVYSQFPGGPQYPDPGSEGGLLPVPSDVVDLGMGAPDSPVPQFAGYDALSTRVAERMGYAIDDFHVFRYRLKYPPIPAMAIVSYPLQRRT